MYNYISYHQITSSQIAPEPLSTKSLIGISREGLSADMCARIGLPNRDLGYTRYPIQRATRRMLGRSSSIEAGVGRVAPALGRSSPGCAVG